MRLHKTLYLFPHHPRGLFRRQNPLHQVMRLNALRTLLQSRCILHPQNRMHLFATSSASFLTMIPSPNDAYEKMVVENVLDISYAYNPRILHFTPLRV